LKSMQVISYDYAESRLYQNEILTCKHCEERHFNKAPEFPPNTPADKITACAEGYAVPIDMGDQYNLIRNKSWNRFAFSSMLPGNTRYSNMDYKHELFIPRRFIHYCANALRDVYVLAYVIKGVSEEGETSKIAFLKRDAMMSTLSNDPEAMALLCMMAGPGRIPEIVQVFDTELIDMYKLVQIVQKMIITPPSDEFIEPQRALEVTRASRPSKKRAPLSQEEDEEPAPKRSRRTTEEYGDQDSSQDN